MQMGAALRYVCVCLWNSGALAVDAPLADPFGVRQREQQQPRATLIDLTHQLWTLSTRGHCQGLRDQWDALNAVLFMPT